jgi:hypothetical protein
MVDERGQQPELERRQLDVLPARPHAPLAEVHLEQPVGVGVAHLLARRPPQHALHAREQLLPSERLRHVVVGPAAQRPYLLQLRPERAQHHDGHVAQLPDALERPPSVELGHRDVEHDEVGPLVVQSP